MNIEDLKVGQHVIADLDDGPELYHIYEINDDGTVNVENQEGGEEGVPPCELRPVPDMPEQLFIDIKGNSSGTYPEWTICSEYVFSLWRTTLFSH